MLKLAVDRQVCWEEPEQVEALPVIAGHHLTDVLPRGALICDLLCLLATLRLQLVNSRCVLDNAGQLVKEHDQDKEAEKQGQEYAGSGDDACRRLEEEITVAVETTPALHGDENHRVEAAQEDVDEELQEELLVGIADAVVHPRAVMVHASDAVAASRAVMALRGLQRVALLALSRHDAIEFLDLSKRQRLKKGGKLLAAVAIVEALDSD